MVYLPEAMTLVRYRNNEVCEQTLLEKGDHYIDVPLTDVVFFVKKGRLVPFCKKAVSSTALIDYTSFDFIGTAPHNTTCTLYHDDGISLNVSANKNLITLQR